jgi:hypothetical protein
MIDLCYGVDEQVKLIEGLINPFLQFSRWKNSVSRDDNYSLDVRQRFRNEYRYHRFLLFACDSGKRFLIVFSYYSKACSPGEVIGGWFI